MLDGPSRSDDLSPRVDPWYLKDRVLRDRVRIEVDQYFQDIVGTVESACVLWEDFKAVQRGQGQALTGGTRKEQRLKCESLEQDCASSKARLMAGDPDPPLLHLRLALKQHKLRE
ncbi:hypothetical protein NDU88_001034 [Pleurodeles waltl]|uniref:Uncharacterized protein n=1 Tax=Pleurodeles waltl TaxID=8319 RepID=A0AAV7MJG6_PLEWA|nr:hypothetical protein NDU88_001034 [Pleurodeles waltl]